MSSAKSLPDRPSLESLRKQAKRLAREVAAGDVAAVARARAHLPRLDLPLTQRNAQLVIAREYGYPGWQDLVSEVHNRLGHRLDQAAAQAARAIHDDQLERLAQLLAEHPGLLAWHGSDPDTSGGLLGIATGSYGDSFDPPSEAHYTRAACAELLIDAGALVTPSVCEGLLQSRARGLLRLFQRKGLLPRTLRFFAALGDTEGVRSACDGDDYDLTQVTEAFTIACSFGHEGIASLLLDQAVSLDPALRAHIDSGMGRPAFVQYFVDNRPRHVGDVGLWKAFVLEQAGRAVSSHSGPETSVASPRGESNVEAFLHVLRSEPWLLGDAAVPFQVEIIERATLKDRGDCIRALLDLDPAVLRRQPPPPSQAIEFAFTYARIHLVPILTRVWPLPDDLPHAAGMGDLGRVKGWFDASGAPALGHVDEHYPSAPYMPKDRVQEYARQWGPHSVQRVLDAALAWSVINTHLEVADFLLTHGADINTRWSSHEPASILHELVFHGNYRSMQFLIDRGIDMRIRDHRWNATARGWALHAARDEKMARWLEDAEREREARTQ